MARDGTGWHLGIYNSLNEAINAPEPHFPTPPCIQTEEESEHFDQLRNFIDNLVLTVTPQAFPAYTAQTASQTPNPQGSEQNKRKSLDDPEHDARLSRRKLSKAEQEAARGLQELSAGV